MDSEQLNVLMASTAVYSVVGGILFCLAWHLTLGALVAIREAFAWLIRRLRPRPVTRPRPSHDLAL